MLAPSISYVPDSNAVSCGRYLEAVDKLHELDIYERGILRHIGARVPLDAELITEAVNCSFGVFALAIGMHPGTAQKKIKALLNKGYIRSVPVFLSSYRGRTYRGPNSYFLTAKVFTGPSAEDSQQAFVELVSTSLVPSVSETIPSENEPPAEALIQAHAEEIAVQVEETTLVDRLVGAWQNAVGLVVSENEKEQFAQNLMQVSAPEEHFQERIELMARSPALIKRARDINMIFKFVDQKYKHSTLPEIEKAQPTCDKLKAPSLQVNEVEIKTKNSCNPRPSSPEISPKISNPEHAKATLPRDREQMISVLNNKLAYEKSEKIRGHIKTILLIAERCPFEMTLSYFQKYLMT